MTRSESNATLRDILAVVGAVARRVAQGVAVTVGVFVVLSLALATNMCGCSTKEKAYIAAMKSDLRMLTTAQETYFADHRTFAPTLEALWDLYTPSRGVTIALDEVTGEGWNAVATHEITPTRCAIFVGAAATPVPESEEAQPSCWEDGE